VPPTDAGEWPETSWCPRRLQRARNLALR